MKKRILIITVIGLFLVACGTPNDVPCGKQGTCPTGTMCSAGLCYKACESDDECKSGRTCFSNENTVAMCTVACKQNADCPDDQYCWQREQKCVYRTIPR